MGSERTKSPMSPSALVEYFGIGKFQVVCLIIVSIIEGADGMEILTLSLLGLLLQCSWHINSTEIALMTTFAFSGMIFGSPILGNLSDRYGRRPGLFIAGSIGLAYALLSSLSPTLNWFYFLRFVFGIGIGGCLSIASTYLAEITPVHFRAKSQSIMFCSWSVGSFLVTGVSALVVPYLGWRWFVFMASIPLMVGIISLRFIDESIRFLIVAGRDEQAREVIKKCSRMNNVPMPTVPIEFSRDSSSENVGDFRLLFSKSYRFLTFIQLISWLCAGALYYGAVILSATMPTISYSCLQNSSEHFFSVLPEDSSCCQKLNGQYYRAIAISSIGDLLSPVLDAFLLDIIGRKRGIAFCAGISAVCFVVLEFCMPVLLRSIVFSMVRCFTLALANGWTIFSLEIYPTIIRGTGFGACQICYRLGGALTSFASGILLRYNTKLALFLYALLAVLVTITTLCVPVETKTRLLEDDLSLKEKESIINSNEANYETLTSRKIN